MPHTVKNCAGLETIVVTIPATQAQPQVNVVILHGYGMSSVDFAPFANSLGIQGNFFVPGAPHSVLPTGRSWWPVDPIQRAARIERRELDLVNEYPSGRAAARQLLMTLCHEIRQGDGSTPLVVCGFSQGGMLACDAVLCGGLKVDGLALFSSSRIAIDEWSLSRDRLRGLPVLISHGHRDEEIAFCAGEALRDFVAGSAALVTWVPFDGAHETPLSVWRALRVFVKQLAR